VSLWTASRLARNLRRTAMRLPWFLNILTLLLGICLAAHSRAQDDGPVRFLIPFEGGSATALALHLAESASPLR